MSVDVDLVHRLITAIFFSVWLAMLLLFIVVPGKRHRHVVREQD